MAATSRVFPAVEALVRLSELVEERRRQLAREAGLGELQLRVLEGIGRSDFMPSLFARGRRTSPAAVSRALRQLIDGGLVAARICADDARRRAYTLTPAGRRVLARVRKRREQALLAVWEGLPSRELDRFAHFAERLAERLEAHAREVDARE